MRFAHNVKSMSLADRDAQLAALSAHWARARSGAGQVVLVEGPVATGKTALLHAPLTEPDQPPHALLPGAAPLTGACRPLVLRASCSPDEASLPLGVAAQLILGLDLPADFRSRATALINRALHANSMRLLHDLSRELLELAARTPLLITVDDVQHADQLSMSWLSCLARRLAAAPILLLIAGDPAARSELLRLPHCVTMQVTPLSERGVTDLLRERFGAPVAVRSGHTFFAASGGNPLLLNALLDDWRAGRGVAGSGYQRALLDCVRRCGHIALRVAQAVALLGEPALVGALLDLDTDTVADAIRLLESAGLLVAHESGRAGLLADLPPGERAALHSGAARLLHDRGAASTVVARHIVAGGGNPLPNGILLDAAETQLLDGDFRAALACVEHAGAVPARLRLALLDQCADPAIAAGQLTSLVADTGLTTDQQAEVCRHLLWHGRETEAAAIIATLPFDSEPRLHDFESWLAGTHPGLAPRRLDRSPVIEVLPADSPPPGPLRRARSAAAAAEIAVRQCDFMAALDHARIALDEISPKAWGTAVGLPLGALVLAATRVGEFDTAAAWLRQPVPAAMFTSRYGLHYRYARGTYELARGNLSAASADFTGCGDLIHQWSLDVPGIVPWRIGLAQTRLRQGKADEARRLLDEQSPGPAQVRLLATCAPAEQKIERLTEAMTIIENSGDRFELALALTELSYAHEASGDHREARRLARRAWHVAKSCHAEPICAELAPRLAGRPGSDDAGHVLLSRAERRVAVLASDGHSNRAIAGKLFITESTVEQHLTKVYRKLNVNNRADLPASLR